MIAIGTLCELVAPPSAYAVQALPYAGRFCTVTGHMRDAAHIAWNIVQVPGAPTTLHAIDQALRPIVPPGDPDRVNTPARKPAELCR